MNCYEFGKSYGNGYRIINEGLHKDVHYPSGLDGHEYDLKTYGKIKQEYQAWVQIPKEWGTFAELIATMIRVAGWTKKYNCRIEKQIIREEAPVMKALSIMPYYASCIASGEKVEEYRSWKTEYRGDLLICASSRNEGPNLVRGHAICVVELYDITQSAPHDYVWHINLSPFYKIQ